MKLSGYLFGLVAGMFLAMAGTVIIGEFAGKEPGFVLEGSEGVGATRYSEFNRSFANFAGLNSSVSGLQDSVKDFQSGNPLEFAGALFRTGYNALTGVFSSFSFMGEMFGASQTIFGVDPRLVGFGAVMVTLIIIVAVLAAIFQTDV